MRLQNMPVHCQCVLWADVAAVNRFEGTSSSEEVTQDAWNCQKDLQKGLITTGFLRNINPEAQLVYIRSFFSKYCDIAQHEITIAILKASPKAFIWGGGGVIGYQGLWGMLSVRFSLVQGSCFPLNETQWNEKNIWDRNNYRMSVLQPLWVSPSSWSTSERGILFAQWIEYQQLWRRSPNPSHVAWVLVWRGHVPLLTIDRS